MSIDAAVITRRLAVMRRLLDHLDRLGISGEADLVELGIQLQVERALTQLVNLAADINAHVAAATGLPPEDYRQGFDRLAQEGFVTTALAEELKPSVGLRNILTHQYVEVDLRQVAAAVPLAINGYRDYVRQVAAHLAEGTC